MSRPGLNVWAALAADDSMLWLKYWWGPGSANALAFKLRDGTWAIVSPPCDAPEHVYAEIARRGKVSALIAPNAFHHKGQSAWRQRFPEARAYAPRGALPRLSKQTPELDYSPLEECAVIAPATVFIPDGMKTPDALLYIPTATGPATSGGLWWLGDQFSNNTKADQIFIFRIISRLVASGPGFWCNPHPELVYVRDRVSWLRSLQSRLDRHPPQMILSAHGDPVTEAAATRALRAIEIVSR